MSEIPSYSSVTDYLEGDSVSEREMPEIEPVIVVLDDEEQDWARIEEAIRWCPLHHSLDCSPRRNACALIDQQRQAFERRKNA